MLNLNRSINNKFGLSILFTVITSALLIAGLVISSQSVTHASEMSEKKNKVQPCKIDPKDMKASPGAPPPPVLIKRSGSGFDGGGGIPCLGDNCWIDASCVSGAFLSPGGLCAMKCCWSSAPEICSESVNCTSGGTID